MITGAIIALVCLLLGVMIGRKQRHARQLPDANKIKAICEGCNHHRSFHNKHDDKCERTSFVDYQNLKCSCQEYMGPEQLPPQYFAGEIV